MLMLDMDTTPVEQALFPAKALPDADLMYSGTIKREGMGGGRRQRRGWDGEAAAEGFFLGSPRGGAYVCMVAFVRALARVLGVGSARNGCVGWQTMSLLWLGLGLGLGKAAATHPPYPPNMAQPLPLPPLPSQNCAMGLHVHV